MGQFGRIKKIKVETKDDLSTKVFEALGAASSCWDNLSGAGEFESTRAKEIGDKLMDDILDVVRNEWTSVQESDLGRQRQIAAQSKMLDISQKKFIRLIEQLKNMSSSVDRYELLGTIQATTEDMEKW